MKSIAIDALAASGLVLAMGGVAHFSLACAAIALGACMVGAATLLARRG